MELTREHFRSMVFYDYTSGLTEDQCSEKLKRAFGDGAPMISIIRTWYGEFISGGNKCEDTQLTKVSGENIDSICRMIMEDCRCTYRDIEMLMGISLAAVKTILHDHLGMRKLYDRWVPNELKPSQKELRASWCKKLIERFNDDRSNAVFDIITGDEMWVNCYEPGSKRQSSHWVFPGAEWSAKVKRGHRNGRMMIASFFSQSGHVATIQLEEPTTLTAEWYSSICLPTVLEKVREKHPGSRILLHYDNAALHLNDEATKLLQTSNVELLDHPPYSPDLTPFDFFLFPKIKEKICKMTFTTLDAAVDAFQKFVSELPEDLWTECFDDWLNRCQKCLDCNGEYFEEQEKIIFKTEILD